MIDPAVMRWGRSPRERGSLPHWLGRGARGGSIPARAGEPARALSSLLPIRVDPRASGGACFSLSASSALRGRSPARAGEPRPSPPCRGRPRVDPRASGGALGQCHRRSLRAGRSPRERGSLAEHSVRASQIGSIPARAGEPTFLEWWVEVVGVDPRASGGATPTGLATIAPQGRSPRERGSRGCPRSASRRTGSIPARAGEPELSWPLGRSRGVDPRASGGAFRLVT